MVEKADKPEKKLKIPRVSKIDKMITDTMKEYPGIFDIPKTIVSWGNKQLDDILGGLPCHIVELYGTEGGGKSTIAMGALAECQRQGKRGLLLDAEFSYDEEYAKKLGVDTKKLLVIKESNMEKVLRLASRFLGVSDTGVVVIDSLPALVPKAVREDLIDKEDFEKRHVANRAALLSEVLNPLVGQCHNNKNSLIIINQLRMKIGVMFGNPETTPGGKALRHFSAQRVDVRPGEKILDGKQVIGRQIKVKAVKNKIKAPELITELTLIYGEGFKENK
jgi:recombination protein RecA